MFPLLSKYKSNKIISMKNKGSICFSVLLCSLLMLNSACSTESSVDGKQHQPNSTPEMDVSILTSANSWVYTNEVETAMVVTDNGINNWEKTTTKIRTYFSVDKLGEINIGLKAKLLSGKSTVKVTFNGASKVIDITETSTKNLYVGTFTVSQKGYHFVEIQGITRTGVEFAEVSHVLIGGSATKGNLYYVKDDVYWGRRGPSVHLSYQKPDTAGDVVWFYNEVTVPKGNDVVNSYFMANGFGEGYFGMQVNSATERRVLFSVWSAFSTDDPNQIPDDYKVEKLAAGSNVVVQDFGNEGSGKQSIKLFNWKADTTYKFLIKAVPSQDNSTDYTAYFYAPESGQWELVASLRRPKTTTYLTRPHSFLENFSPSMGDKVRKVSFTNQWVYDVDGTWHELVEAKFTADATARKEARLDYSGGLLGEGFFLRNCGFFSDNEIIDSFHTRTNTGVAPVIDFDSLPK